MNKEEFYEELFGGNTELQELFEGYKGDSYSELQEFVLEKAQEQFYFPNDDPELQEGRTAINDAQRARFNLFSRTLEEGTDYSPEALRLARDFLANRNALINQQ